MKFNLKVQSSRILVATVLVASTVTSFAATGFSVTDIEESRIQIGMSNEQVLQAIGKPFNTVQFRNQDGPTWAYHVSGDLLGAKTFYVDFDAKSKVAAVSEVAVAVGSGDI